MKKGRRALALGLLAALAGAVGVLSSASLRLAAAGNGASGLSVFVGYAEDKETNTPDPASFPTPWAGAPNTVFLGNPVPGGSAPCGSLPTCWDAGGIRLDNSGPTPVVVSSVNVDDHSAITGGKLFQNLWGSFTVPAGESAILTENPPASNPNYNNFDTSGYPGNNCTPIAIAPTVTITVAGIATTLADSTHVLDTGGIDTGYCQPKHNESIQWRAIGAASSNTATLTLAPTTITAFTGGQASETATLLDGGGIGLPNTTVNYSVTSGPDAGLTGSAVTDYSGRATFTFSSAASGVDILAARTTTVGSFQSNPARVMWANDSSTGWSSADIGSATPTGTQSLDTTTGAWTVAGGGSDINGTSDQFRFLWQTLPSPGGVAARVSSQTNTDPWAKAGIMLRSTSDPGSPYYAAFVTPSNGLVVQDRASQGGATVTLVNPAGAPPAYLWVTDSGGTLAAFTSNDGYIWSRLPGSAAALNLGSTLLAGLAVTSRNSSMLSTVTMDTVAVTGSPPPPLPPVACPAPWACADIGNPTPAGSQSFDANSGTWTINAGGADVTGTSDQFHFVWQPLSGNAGISAHVTSQTNTSSSAKAGVMLRQTTNAASPYYAVLVSPGAGIKVQVRTVQGGNTTKLANPTGTVPAYLMVTTSGGKFSAFTSADGVTWTVIPGSTITLNLGSTLLAGLAMTSHNSGALCTVTMDTVSLGGSTPPTPTPTPTPTPSPLCPSAWICADIGNLSPAGSQSFDANSGTWTINAGGADITGTSDQFHFVWQPLSGNAGISAHVTSQTNTSSSAKAGVMLRQTTDAASPYYAVFVTPGTGIKVQVRTVQGGSTTKLANPTGTVPAYLMVTTSGGKFSAFTSADGVTWTVIPGSTITLNLGSTLLAGLAVTSHNSGALCTVTMNTVVTS